MDVNADVGESFGPWRMGRDEALVPLVTSANVACGFHAGDPAVIDRTVALCARHGVAVGAHPSYHDLRGFGRRVLPAAPAEIETDVLYQVAAVAGFCRAHRVPLVHVKPHGALYNQAAIEPEVADAVARGVARAAPEAVLVGLATTAVMREAAARAGLRYAAEAFADRRYERDGTLQSRHVAGAVIEDADEAAAQAVAIATRGRVRASDGSEVPLAADTLCLHGDNPSALRNAEAVRRALIAAGVEIRAL
ncbi:MAG TPA: 5-oxoprolinase subunit PxpA [Vicinamibacteria bacterium]|nr:5-oxoprolinase subunit PxpA [Vicinamibacteria bacterium]